MNSYIYKTHISRISDLCLITVSVGAKNFFYHLIDVGWRHKNLISNLKLKEIMLVKKEIREIREIKLEDGQTLDRD